MVIYIIRQRMDARKANVPPTGYSSPQSSASAQGLYPSTWLLLLSSQDHYRCQKVQVGRQHDHTGRSLLIISRSKLQ